MVPRPTSTLNSIFSPGAHPDPFRFNSCRSRSRFVLMDSCFASGGLSRKPSHNDGKLPCLRWFPTPRGDFLLKTQLERRKGQNSRCCRCDMDITFKKTHGISLFNPSIFQRTCRGKKKTELPAVSFHWNHPTLDVFTFHSHTPHPPAQQPLLSNSARSRFKCCSCRSAWARSRSWLSLEKIAGQRWNPKNCLQDIWRTFQTFCAGKGVLFWWCRNCTPSKRRVNWQLGFLKWSPVEWKPTVSA